MKFLELNDDAIGAIAAAGGLKTRAALEQTNKAVRQAVKPGGVFFLEALKSKELIKIVIDQLSTKDLANCAQTSLAAFKYLIPTLFERHIQKLFTLILHQSLAGAPPTINKNNVRLFFIHCSLTDLKLRTFINTSILKYLAWAAETETLQALLEYKISDDLRKKASQQLAEQQTVPLTYRLNGQTHSSLDAVQDMLDALQEYGNDPSEANIAKFGRLQSLTPPEMERHYMEFSQQVAQSIEPSSFGRHRESQRQHIIQDYMGRLFNSRNISMPSQDGLFNNLMEDRHIRALRAGRQSFPYRR